MKVNSTCLLLITLIFLLCQPAQSYSGCTSSNSTAIGCLACDTPTTHSYAFNQSQMKYTCIATLNCVSVAGDSCTGCLAPSYLDAVANQCVSLQGCIQVSNGTCLTCQPINYVLLQGQCYNKQINFCTEYALNTTLVCLKCAYQEMDPAMNCTYNASVCQLFDYQVFRCKKCPVGKYLHSDGKSCYTPILNCQVYESSTTPTCLLCKSNYIFNPTTNACVLGQPLGIDSQILTYNLSNTSPAYSYICLNNFLAMNQTSFDCSISAPVHCSQLNSTNSTLCLQCLPGYYLRSTDSTCIQCQVTISNCALCSASNVCSACAQTYFLVNTTTSSVCMSCSSFGCLDCSTDFDSSGKVKCISCAANKTLYAGSCISCSSTSLAYYVAESDCRSCNDTIPNCIFCQFTAETSTSLLCKQCAYGYFYYSANATCLQIQTTTQVQFETASQILRKVAPGSNYSLYPDAKSLVSYCNSTDGFTCICSSTNLTSLCSSFTLIPNISALIFNTSQKIAMYPDELRMAAELPSFNLLTNLPQPVTLEPLSLYQFWNFLAALTFNIVRDEQNGVSTATSIVNRIFNQAKAMLNVFSDQKVTILRGNGFYFKYIPKGLASGGTGDDSYLKTSLSNINYVIVYSYYSRLLSLSSGSLTGKIYVYTENPQADFSVTVRKTRYADSSSSYSVKVQGAKAQNNVTVNNGLLQIKSFPKSIVGSAQGLQVFGVAASATQDIYVSQRIQNIFYSESWLYILFFIALYLIFIPLCAIVDCCETQSSMRKKVNTQQPSENKEESNQNRQSQQQNVVKVNYRDFFPLYNVGNTPRPWRLDKLCLFIVNMQHIITFLTIIYFQLPGSLPIAAIALVIPAYLCTVIMGYICGAIFRFLPGHFKLLINLISLGYWILWIFLMKIMSVNPSKQYRLFILVFSILSFFLDLTIDALQTLLVYFAIKQGEKQVSLFQCLAKWLSLRGFYQFDKLAKQLEESES